MDPTSHHAKPSSHVHKPPSTSDLLSSAKVVAEAAKSTFRHETSKVDKAKVAGAAEDLLCAASHYGKLEEKSFGKYVDKAETYLHQYHSSHSTTTTHSTTSTSSHSSTTHHSSSTQSQSGGDGHSEGGFGDYLKLAEGFLKKH